MTIVESLSPLMLLRSGIRRPNVAVVTSFMLSFCALASAASAQTTWYVDDDAPGDLGWGDPSISDPLEDGSAEHPFDAIQEGIDAAIAGDTVLVLDGTYTGVGNRGLVVSLAGVMLRSENGPQTCIIDCENAAVSQGASITAVATVQGLTIRNCGMYFAGAGMRVSGNASINDCIFEDNSAGSRGGGMYLTADNATISDCLFQGNTSLTWGGGIRITGDSTIQRCTFTGNGAEFGGGIAVNTAAPTIRDCVFEGNTADYGGGLYLEGDRADLVVEKCTFLRNEALIDGGGIFTDINDILYHKIRDCALLGNSAAQHGGGLALGTTGQGRFPNLVLIGNQANKGGGVSRQSSTGRYVVFVNATISANEARTAGGGIHLLNGGGIFNSVVWANTGGEIASESGIAVIEYNNVLGGAPGSGNIDADPIFVRAPDPGPDADWGTEDDDYGDLHLRPGSPCIDAADNANVWAVVTSDFDGHTRFADDPATTDTGEGDPPIVDMGAYEHHPGDCDADGDTNLLDLDAFTDCMLGPGGSPSLPECACFDLDATGSVGLLDFSFFQMVFGAE